MLKLNASYSKKVPAEGEYSSQSYHACVEVELPDGLTQEQLQGRIHETFEMVRNSVEAELHGKSPGNSRGFVPENGSQTPVQYGHPASSKQLQYLLDIARNCGANLKQLAARYNVADVRQLTKQQCSKLINELSGKAA